MQIVMVVKEMDKFSICTFAGLVGAVICEMLGGWDTAIQTLLIFMVIDFIMGIVVAVVFKNSDKSESGALSSKACWKGIAKKVCTLLIVVCSTYADKLLETDYIRNAVVIGFCASEFISIIELAGLMGILPKQVQQLLNKAIDVLHMKSGGDDNGNN